MEWACVLDKWGGVALAPSGCASRASIWPRVEKSTALKSATAVRGVAMPLYNPRGPFAASTCALLNFDSPTHFTYNKSLLWSTHLVDSI